MFLNDYLLACEISTVGTLTFRHTYSICAYSLLFSVRKDEVASLLHLFYVVNQGKMKMERDLFRHTFHRLFDITGDVILDRRKCFIIRLQ